MTRATVKGPLLRTFFDVPFDREDLASITIGPVYADLNVPVVKRLLQHHGFTKTKVEIGTVALRTLPSS